MSNENNKCVILRKLMNILDNVLANGVNGLTCKRVAEQLDNYRGESQTFDTPAVDDFFRSNSISHRALNAVMADVDNHVELPEILNCPVGAGTLLFALHEYQHRYHEDDDPLLVDGKSTLELRARGNIEHGLGNDGWGSVQLAMCRVYESAKDRQLIETAYRLIEVREAIQDWLPAGYEKIFIDYK